MSTKNRCSLGTSPAALADFSMQASIVKNGGAFSLFETHNTSGGETDHSLSCICSPLRELPSVLKHAIKTPKVYFRDTGLASYLTRWLTPETLAYGAMAGNMFETFVISEILKSYSNQGIDYRYCVSYYRGKDKKEHFRNSLCCKRFPSTG